MEKNIWMNKIYENKRLLISLTKRTVFVAASTVIIFNFINNYTASLMGYVDGCDTYGYPLVYSQNCETRTYFHI